MSDSTLRGPFRLPKLGLLAAFALTAFVGDQIAVRAQEVTPEQRPCVNMLEAWYGVMPEKIDGLFHENFIKQGVYVDPRTGELQTPTRNRAEFTADINTPRRALPEDQWGIEAETVHLSGILATVVVRSVHLVDVCQLGKIGDDWQIINVLWSIREQG